MKAFVFACLLVGATTVSAQTTGTITLGHSDTLPSELYTETQRINVYLPPGYHPDSAQTYPVIYLLDGAVDEDFIHIAGLVQFSTFSWVNYLQPSILVGVESTDRKRDMTYCPANSFNWPASLSDYSGYYPTSGQSANFMRYIETELIPYVEQTYRCSGERTLIGQSLAGLFATEMLLKKPALFHKFVIISPSLWWGNEALLHQASQLVQSLPDSPMRIYIAVGKEGAIMEKPAKKLYKTIKKAAKPATRLTFAFLPDEDHGTILHQAAGDAFEWMKE